MINFSDLEALVLFCEYGTLTATSEKMGVSQSALTRSMQKIEQELKVPLFERTKNSIKPNEAGLMAASHAKELLHRKTQMAKELQKKYLPQKDLSIGICTMNSQISAQIHHLVDCCPEYKLSLSYHPEEQLLEGLREGEYHMIIISSIPDTKQFFSKEFCLEELALSIPFGHELASEESTSFDVLNGKDYLFYHEDILFWRRILKNKMPDSKLIELKTIYALNELTRSSSLPCIASTKNVAMLSSHNRKIMQLNDESVSIHFYLVIKRNQYSKFEHLLK